MAGWIAAALLAAVLGVAWWGRTRKAKARRAAAPEPVGPAAGASRAMADAHVDADRDWVLALVLDGQADAGPVGADDADAAIVAATERRLRRFASEPQQLPRRPQLLPQLLGTLRDDEASARELADLVARDPALAAGLLRLANSSFHRVRAQPVESLERAVALVGTGGLRQLVALALLQPVMQADGGSLGGLPGRIWEHTQLAAEAASRHAPQEGEDGFAAQLLALLRGLGSIVVLQALRDACADAGRGAPAPEVTAGLLRSASPRIAALVARHWELSPRLGAALEAQERADPRAMDGLARALALSGPAAMVRMQAGEARAPA